MFKKIVIVLAVLIVAGLVIVSMQPDHFQVTRSMTIQAAPAKVFAIVNDLHRWNDWSPWASMDPTMTSLYAGPATGLGSSQSWSGKKMGEGKMTITQSLPNERIAILLEFIKPFKITDTSEFIFKPAGKGTEVTWTMNGNNNFMAKAMHMVMNMDKMIGGDFERGLTVLKSIAEAPKK